MRWLLAVMVGCWILLIPPGAGPDEPAHTVRGAATVRGDFSGRPIPELPGYRRYDVPNWVGLPDPVCYAFQPEQPASCLSPGPDAGPGDLSVAVVPSDAPIWGSAVAGLGTLFPRGWGATWAPRAFDALLPTVLVSYALLLARRSGRVIGAGAVVALTPMAWFSIAVVSPSGLAIAGGLALWIALALRSSSPEDRSVSLLATLGWVALVLPRRDGLMWASIIVAIFVFVTDDDPRRLWRWLRPAERAAVAGSALVFATWAATASTTGSAALILTPAAIGIARLARISWQYTRLGVAAAAACVLPVGLFVSSLVRPSGFNSRLFVLTLEHTGNNLIESVGLLGWLDTTVPTVALFGWWALVGVLAAAAMLSDSGLRWVLAAISVVVITVVSTWVLEMSIERYDGNYWQGRYSLPLLLGFPVLLGVGARLGELDPAQRRRVARVGVIGATVVTNLALLSAVRRWGVGTGGTLAPWSWDTYDAPIPVVALLVGHVVASALFARAMLTASPAGHRSVEIVEPATRSGGE